jgi:hypothetical protein
MCKREGRAKRPAGLRYIARVCQVNAATEPRSLGSGRAPYFFWLALAGLTWAAAAGGLVAVVAGAAGAGVGGTLAAT